MPHQEIVAVSEEKGKTDNGLWLGVPFSYDINMINSPIDLSYLRSPFNSSFNGHSVGLTVAKRWKHVEVGSGIIYSDKTYAPGALKNYFKSSSNSFLESTLDQADLTQVQIPLFLKVHAPSLLRSNLYSDVQFFFSS